MKARRPGAWPMRLAGLALAAACGAAAAGGGDSPVVVELAAGGNWHFASPPPASLAALERAWGQFELRLPAKGFVVPAPNCRNEIRLRWIGLPPDAPKRPARIEARWKLLRRLEALRAPASSAEPERVPLDLRYYTRHGRDGRLELQYCNAFVSKDVP
ncbi:MAG: hypothetical protein KGM91_10120 [Burkholderiales bacterium]|nr:hypothetical protein [Burkholderiales bacterium]